MILTYTLAYGLTVVSTVAVGYVGTKVADKYVRKKKKQIKKD